MVRMTTLRALAASAALAVALAACGGGGGSSAPSPGMLPSTGTSSTSRFTSYLSVTLPPHTNGGTTSQAIGRKPLYIDTTTQNSALVASVTPLNPAAAAQYGTVTVCYNLYTNGVLNTGASGNYITTVVGTNLTQVQLGIPTPPGVDGFQITQYAGQCGSSIYSLPTPPPGTAGTGVLAQTPVTYATMTAGSANNINTAIGACFPQPVAPVTAASTCGTVGGGPTTLSASVTIANIAFGTLPIASPVREQGGFLIAAAGAQRIGVPIPLEALNAAGTVIPGLTNPTTPNGGAGPFPAGVTVTSNDATAHTTLYLVDATNGGIAQKAASNAAGLTIHEFNALSANTTTGLTNNCNASGAASCNDITFGGSTAVAGDPWVIVMAFDGTDASLVGSVTVTASAIISPATTATTITTTITPQSAVYTALTPGYADLAGPVAPLNMLQVGANNFFTDGTTVKIDGSATVSSAAGAKLAGLAYATWPNPTTQTTKFIYATDQGQAGSATVVASATDIASGVYSWVAPGLTGPLPVAAQAGAGNYYQFQAPVAVCQAQGVDGAYYLYVVDKTGAIFQLDIGLLGANDGNGFQLATNTVQLLTTGSTAVSPGTATFLGTAPAPAGSKGFLIADPGNNRIALVNTTVSPAAITAYATGAPFTGIFVSGTAVYATSTTGQVYYISGSGATPVSFGLTLGTAADGPVGPISSLTPTANLTLAPVIYGLQGSPKSFFDNTANFAPLTGAAYTALAAPYTILPFGGTKVFAAAVNAGVGLANDTNGAAITGAGVVKATGGLVVVPAGGAAAANVTPDSILFVDAAGKLRTLVR